MRDLSKKDNRTARRLMTCYGRAGRPYMKRVALECLKELPELRMLEKALTYIGQLRYQEHQEVVEALVQMLEDDVFPLPYQAARVIETVGFMHPEDSTRIGARIRKYGLERKRRWPVRQKTGEAVSVYPYREDHAASVAGGLIEDPVGWVRRAGLVLLTRGPVQVVRERVHELIYHPAPLLSQLALFYMRHLNDDAFVRSQLTFMRRGAQSDISLSRRIPQWWLISCHESPEVVKELRDYLLSVASKSSRIQWHVEALEKRTQWVEAALSN